jgi:alcohol oxidase
MIIAMYLAYFGDHSMLPDDSEYVSMACWTAYPCKSSPTSLL